MKKSAKNRIIIWSVVSAVLICILVVGLTFSSSLGISSKWLTPKLNVDYSSYSSGNSEFNATDVKSLDINWTSGKINFEHGSGNKIEISETSNSTISDEEKMVYKLDSDGTLTINGFIADSFWFSFGSGVQKTLTVTIPDNKAFKDVSISTASADFNCDKLTADSISTETASGRVTLKNVDSKSFNADTASGDVNVKGNITDETVIKVVSAECNFESNCKKFDASGVSGNINATLGSKANDVNAETVSGEISFTFPESISGIKAKHSSVSGNFTSDFDGKSNDDTFTSGDGSIDVNMQTVSGSMNIFKAE